MIGQRAVTDIVSRWRPGLLILLTGLLSAWAPPAAAHSAQAFPAGSGDGPSRHANTFAKDFVMDAPWRVKSEQTAIPLTIILKDCDVDDVRELHWIRCWDVTSGETLIWGHDFGDEEIGDDASEDNFWTYITTVTESHPSLPNGTLLTPANLGYGPGDVIRLKVSIYYRDDWFNYTETRYLRVHVARAPYPWPADWFGGDLHYHTMYTNNIAEFGAPLPAVTSAGRAMGLDWLITTDHSCDLDEMGDGSFSYRTSHWEYTVQDENGTQTVYRDNNAIGSTWDVLGEEVALFETPDFRLYRGVELNVASIDPSSYDKTLHCLVYNEAYIHSPDSGAPGERPVTPSLPDGLDQITGSGCAYAAHPLSDLGMEWGGLDLAVNGALWGTADIDVALTRDVFRGLQLFNTRETRESNDQDNPWSDFDAGQQPDNPYPNELLAGISLWDARLKANLEPPVRRIFIAGGSDAHGDFNYATYMSLDDFATDNAIGKVQTVACVPGAGDDLPAMAEILAAVRAGATVATDGPFVNLGVDANGDGDFYDPDDFMIGDEGTASIGATLPLTVRWKSTEDFGPVVSVELLALDAASTTPLLSFDPTSTGEDWEGERVLDLGPLQLEGSYCFRVQCRTDRGDDAFRAFTNPVWIEFEPASEVIDSSPATPGWLLEVRSLGSRCEIEFELPPGSPGTLTIHEISGRRLRSLDLPRSAGPHALVWDGTDAQGNPAPAGVYLFTLRLGTRAISHRAVLVR